MLFWMITGGLTLVVVATLLHAQMRGGAQARPAAAYDLDVYRDQLREVERDLERGVLSPADGEQALAEVSRRILAADAALRAAEAGGAQARGGPVLAALTAAMLIGGAFWIYLQLGAPGYGDLALSDRIEAAQILRQERPSQDTAEASVTEAPPVDATPDYVALVDRLRAAVQSRPDDLQGLVLLSQSEARLGNFAAAHAAKARVIALKGADATAQDFSEYADMMILAAGGYVSPEAEQVLERTLAMDRGDGAARYYYGLMMAQTGRPDVALRIWDQLLREGPEDAPWIAPIDAQMGDIAMRAGVDYARPAIGSGAVRGPTQEQIDSASDMSPAEQMQMIEGMVAGLSDRLATQGGPVEEWAQLISALGVLGDLEQARAIFDNAMEAFGEDLVAVDLLNHTADRIGLQ